MKYLLMASICVCLLTIGSACTAWDGFDAETADLVEILPDKVPAAGDSVDVRDYETDETQTCVVENIIRNRRTIEVLVRTPGGERRTLVMENR